MNAFLETPSSFLRNRLAICGGGTTWKTVVIASAVAAWGILPAHAQNTVDTFTNAAGNGSYTTASNWSTGSVPNLSTATTALINDGAAVTYTPGGDLVISNGGTLEISSGSFTQAGGNNYIQLGQQGQGAGTGNGTVLVDGGTFNQGTDSASPFNLTGTGNAFTVSAGTANISSNFQINTGLAFTQSGGTVNVAGNETDFSGGTSLLSGGTLVTNLITGVNGPGGNTFNISGGTLNLTGSTAIYGGGSTQYINFTTSSNGEILFSNSSDSVSQVQGFINSSVIEYNNTAMSPLSDFSITQSGSDIILTLSASLMGGGGAVPEPTTIFGGLLMVGAMGWSQRRRVGALVGWQGAA